MSVLNDGPCMAVIEPDGTEFIIVYSTREQREMARVEAEEFERTRGKKSKRDSILHGGGNFSGLLGEIVVADFYGWKRAIGNFDYDMVSLNGLKIEVKTKDRTVFPKRHYDASVCAANPNQGCDAYFFTQHGPEHGEIILLGCLDKITFYKQARHCPKGSAKPGGGVFRETCQSIHLNHLLSPRMIASTNQKVRERMAKDGT